MGFLKKQSAGFYLTMLTVIFAALGLIFYVINCNTAYFKNSGIDIRIVVCILFAAAINVILIVASWVSKDGVILDMIPIASAVFLVLAFVTFASSRIASIATIMTFENNAQTMSDLSSALTGIVFCFLAVLFSVASSFFRIVKE